MATKDISDIQVCRAHEVYQTQMGFARTNPAITVFWPYEILMSVTGQAEKVCYRATERAHRRGYIEYGVSLRTGWLTLKGKQLIAPETFSTKERVP